jgi:hypothetical protein
MATATIAGRRLDPLVKPKLSTGLGTCRGARPQSDERATAEEKMTERLLTLWGKTAASSQWREIAEDIISKCNELNELDAAQRRQSIPPRHPPRPPRRARGGGAAQSSASTTPKRDRLPARGRGRSARRNPIRHRPQLQRQSGDDFALSDIESFAPSNARLCRNHSRGDRPTVQRPPEHVFRGRRDELQCPGSQLNNPRTELSFLIHTS